MKEQYYLIGSYRAKPQQMGLLIVEYLDPRFIASRGSPANIGVYS